MLNKNITNATLSKVIESKSKTKYVMFNYEITVSSKVMADYSVNASGIAQVHPDCQLDTKNTAIDFVINDEVTATTKKGEVLPLSFDETGSALDDTTINKCIIRG
jgi:hypothetical protein